MDTSFASNETKHVNLSQQDYIGECSCALADIVGNRYGEKKMHLSQNGVQKKSEMVITSEELRGQNDLVQVGSLVICTFHFESCLFNITSPVLLAHF